MLAFQPLRTKNLRQHDLFTENDVFVEAVYGDLSHHTETIRNTNNPAFSNHEIMMFPMNSEITELQILIRETDLTRNRTLKRFFLTIDEIGSDFNVEQESDHLVFKVACVEILPENTQITLVETAVKLEETKEKVQECRSQCRKLKSTLDDVEQENTILHETCRKHEAQIERLTDLIHEMESEKSSALDELLRHQKEMQISYNLILSMLQDTNA